MLLPIPRTLFMKTALVLILILCWYAPVVCGTRPETRVGPFLAALFTELEIPDTMPALTWAAVAMRHGLHTAGDLASAALADHSASWDAFTAFEVLVTLGVPAGAVATLLTELREKLRGVHAAGGAFFG